MYPLRLTVAGRELLSEGSEVDDFSEVDHVAEGAVVSRRPTDTGHEISFRTDGSLKQDTVVEASLRFPQVRSYLLPTYQGVLERHLPDDLPTVEFRGPGWQRSLGDERRLALPMIVVETGDGVIAVGADPAFSLTVQPDDSGDGCGVSLSWTYRAAAGAHEQLRRIVCAPASSAEAALDVWFAYATPDVPVGPEWLHEIALQDYDYFSKNGDGWFRDLEAASEMIDEADRHRALFTLHGWYDEVGRFCFDPTTGKLDEEWRVFPFIASEELLARELVQQPENNLPRGYAFRNLRDYRPLELNWAEVRKRLRHAKDLGFRTGFYLLTGLMALGDRELHVKDGTGLETEAVLWIGPDAVGRTYLMNPLHPEVRSRVLALTEALLERVGDLVDAMVIDEAYYIGYGELGPASCPGYADQAQASLIHELARLCHGYDPSLAVLTADHLGTQTLEGKAYPYSLFADGIYHDAWCHAQPWQACRLPAWRNVVWSCNWAPSTEILNTKWAVLAEDAPIAISNGCFGDDIGLADMSEEQRALIAELWKVRKSRTRTRSLQIVNAFATTEERT